MGQIFYMKYLSNNSRTEKIIFKKTVSVTSPEGEEIDYNVNVTEQDVIDFWGKPYDSLTSDEQFEVYIHFCVRS